MIASRCCPRLKVTSVTPSSVRSLSSATFIGPGEGAVPAGLEIEHIDEADEMHAIGVEAVPAGALRAATIALTIELLLIIEEVMLARHIVHVEASLGDDPVGVVEF